MVEREHVEEIEEEPIFRAAIEAAGHAQDLDTVHLAVVEAIAEQVAWVPRGQRYLASTATSAALDGVIPSAA